MTASDCWLTTLSLFAGMCIWTFLGGIVTTLLIHLNAASSEYTAKITALNQYMAHRRLPQARMQLPGSWEPPCMHACMPACSFLRCRRVAPGQLGPQACTHCSSWNLLLVLT